MAHYHVLNDLQAQSFLDKGYLIVKGCLDRTIASRWMDEAFDRLGYDRNDPQTWTKDIV